MSARTEGARAAGRKVVDTGWRYDPTTAAISKPKPKDDDPEPAQRPAAPGPRIRPAVRPIVLGRAEHGSDPGGHAAGDRASGCGLGSRSLFR